MRSVRRVVVVSLLIAVTAGFMWPHEAALADGDGGKLAVSGARLEPGSAAEYLLDSCRYSSTLTYKSSGAPVSGATITVIETGTVTRTDSRGNYSAAIPGAGTWNLRITNAGSSTVVLRLVVDSPCVLVSSDFVADTGVSAQPSGGSERFSGNVLIDGDPAPAGVSIVARVGNVECGRALISQPGAYSVDVAGRSQIGGCGAAGSQVQFSMVPAFGSGWRLSRSYAFEPGTSSTADLAIDLTRLGPPDPANVPLFPRYWDDLGSVLISACADVSDTAWNAAVGAYTMWANARANQGLLAGLNWSDDACRDDRSSIVLGEVHWDDRPTVVGAHLALDRNGRPCADNPGRACRVWTSVVAINLSAGPLTDQEWARVMAHEIGHALGLDHAHACNGGTIMFEDMICQFPAKSLGVDDIAALNRRYNEQRPVSSVPTDASDLLRSAREAGVIDAERALAEPAPATAAAGSDPARLQSAASFDDWLVARAISEADLLAGETVTMNR